MANGLQFYTSISIDEVELDSQIIVSLTIREWIFEHLPRLELIIGDDGSLSELYPLQDNNIISIKISNSKDEEVALEMDFKMLDYRINPSNEQRNFIQITGIMANNDIFAAKNRSFPGDNSLDVLEKIADEEGITFSNPWNVNPVDNMTWYQYSLSNYDFIRHVLERAYITDDAVFFYANSQNKFVYTSLRAEAEKSSDDIKFAKNHLEKSVAFDLKPKDRKTIWYSTYDLVNVNGYNNKKCGYGVTYTYYDLKEQVTKNLFYNNIYGELSFRDKTKVLDDGGNPSCAPVYGHLNNVYDKYFESKVRNKMLINQFFSFSYLIRANGLSDVSLFDKVNLIAPALFGGPGSDIDDHDVNEMMSGDYLVGGITHQISGNGIYNKLISLHRDGMNKSPHVDNYSLESGPVKAFDGRFA